MSPAEERHGRIPALMQHAAGMTYKHWNVVYHDSTASPSPNCTHRIKTNTKKQDLTRASLSERQMHMRVNIGAQTKCVGRINRQKRPC